MKSAHFKIGFALWIAASLSLGAVDKVYRNRGNVTTAPNIDATVFINEGTFDIFTSQPFETLHTRYFTNASSGLLRGSPGYWFNFSTNDQRKLADYFVNRGRIIGQDDGMVTGAGFVPSETGARVFINASNVVNSGIIDVTQNGLIRITGKNVNLRQSGLRAAPPIGASIMVTTISGDTNQFYPPAGVIDLWWGRGTNNVLGADGNPIFLPNGFDAPNTRSPAHQVIDSGNFTNTIVLPYFSFEGFQAYAFTNRINATNELIQVVFVSTNSMDSNISIDVGFAPGSGGAANPGFTEVVGFSILDFDPVYEQPFTNYLYIADYGAWTNSVRFQKNANNNSTQKPANFEVFTFQPNVALNAQPSNAQFSSSLIYNPSYANRVVTNRYSAYAFEFGSPAFSAAPVVVGPGGSNPSLNDPTNKPGRIEITADHLDASQLRLRSENLLQLNVKDFVGTPDILDAAVMSLNLGSTNGTLVLSNLAPASVQRLSGDIACWSGSWLNSRTELNPDGSTNTVGMRFHVLIVDSTFTGAGPVQFRDFTLTATNAVIEDQVSVGGKFVARVQNLTINGSLVVTTNLSASTLPILRNFTNLGSVSFIGTGEFGMTAATRLENWVNRGFISGDSFFVGADFVENSGTLTANAGPIEFNADKIDLSSGVTQGAGDLTFTAAELQLGGSMLQAGGSQFDPFSGVTTTIPGRLNLSISDLLTDGGSSSGAQIFVLDGFQLAVKPAAGDLLGSSVNSTVPPFRSATHVWAGEDRGASSAGYQDNAAIGKLTIDIQRRGSSAGFSGVGGANAIYVDYLELLDYATNYLDTATLSIGDDIIIYFADSNLPAEKLNGRADGRLRWVPDYAGAFSSTNITYPSGTTYTFNRALVASSDQDSDGDGIPNSQDPTPIPTADNMNMKIQSKGDGQVEVSWFAPAKTRTVLESAPLENPSSWSPLKTGTTTTTGSRFDFIDATTGSAPTRIYRIRVLK